MDIDIRSYPPQYREALEELQKILHLQTELAEKAESEFHVDRAVAQAEEVGVGVDEELIRLCVHGTLHVLGYDHAGSPL